MQSQNDNGGGKPSVDTIWVDVNWTFVEPPPTGLLQGFDVALYSGADANDTANYFVEPIRVHANDRRLVKAIEYPKGKTAPNVKASVRAVYSNGRSAWNQVGVSATPTITNLMTVANDNLIPNATGEQGFEMEGYAQALLVNDPGNAYVGNYVRKLDASATNTTAISPVVPCIYGDQFALDGYMKVSNAAVAGRLVLKFYDASGSVVGTSTGDSINSTSFTTTNKTAALRCAAPATAVSCQAFVEAATTGASQFVYLDNVSLRRAVVSKHMGADEGFRVINSFKNSGNTNTDVVWQTGNNDPNTNGGAPIILDPLWNPTGQTRQIGDRVVAGAQAAPYSYAVGKYVYECTQSGTEMSAADYTTAQGAVFWSSVTTYAVGNIVLQALGGQTHACKSLQNSNLNHTPTLGGDTWWQDLGCIYGPQGTDPAAGSTNSGIGNGVLWKCVGWMWTTGATPGCKPWARSTAYAVGDLVCSDVGATAPGYTATADKLYGQPEGARLDVGGTWLNYGGTKIYRCTTAGTSSASGNGPSSNSPATDGTVTWTYFGENTGPEERLQIWHLNTFSDSSTYGSYDFEFRIQPKTAKDNLDALTHATVEIIKSDNTTTARAATWTAFPHSVTMPSRKYYYPGTHNAVENMSRTVFKTGMIPAVSFIGSTPFASTLKLRVRLHNTFGRSIAVDYTLWNSTNTQPAPFTASYTNFVNPPSGGGGGGGGGGCPAPETLVDVWMDGAEAQKPAGEVQVGDLVQTYHAATDTRGIWPVLAVSRWEDAERWLVTFTDGFQVKVSRNHRFFVLDGRQVEVQFLMPGDIVDGDSPREVASCIEADPGPVMAISVDQAHTYQTSGLLQSNVKPG